MLVGTTLLVMSLLVVLSFLRQPGENVSGPDDHPSPVKSTRAGASSPRGGGYHEAMENSVSPARAPEEIAAARETILGKIQDAAVSYDAAELPKIEPYLLHPDQEIRQAAMNGMITLGDKAAGPLLRKAAASAPTPQEAVALMEAADYVELPPAKLRRRSK